MSQQQDYTKFLPKMTEEIKQRKSKQEVNEELNYKRDLLMSDNGLFPSENMDFLIDIRKLDIQPKIVDQLTTSYKELGFFSRWGEEIELSSKMGKVQTEFTKLNLKALETGNISPEDKLRRNELKKELENYFSLRENENFFTGAVRSTFQQFVPQAVEGVKYAGEYAITAGAAAGLATAAGGASLPATPITSGTAALVGGVYGLTQYSYKTNAAELYGNLLDMEDQQGNDIDTDTARIVATLGSLPAALLDSVGINAMTNLFPGIKKLKSQAVNQSVQKALQSPSVAQLLGTSATEITKAIGTEVITEIGQEGVFIGAEEFAKNISGLEFEGITKEEAQERLKETAYETLKAVILPVGIGGGISQTRNSIRTYRESATKMGQLQPLIANVKTNSFIKENPEIAETELKKIFINKEDLQTIYLPAQQVYETFFQSDEGIAFAKNLGITATNVFDALTLDTFIAIPTEKALSKLFTSKYGEALEQYAVYLPDDMSLSQLSQYEKEIGIENLEKLTAIESVAESTLELMYNEELELQELDSLANPLVQNLREGGYTENQAKQYGRILGANAQIMASIFRMNPAEYLQNRLEITSSPTFGYQEKHLKVSRKENPLFELIYSEGLSSKSLKEQYPHTYKQIIQNHGTRLFKKNSNSIDIVADMAVRRGLLSEGSGANELVDYLSKPFKEYYQASNISNAQQALDNDVQAWQSSVDSFLNGSLTKTKQVRMLNQTPLVLQMLGAKNLPVETSYNTLKKVLIEKHKLPEAVLKQVPKAMADPIMVFKSATVGGDLVMMLDLKDEKGATVVVPISLEQVSGYGSSYEINYVPSIYGRADFETGRVHNNWFINQIEQGNLIYQNKQKSLSWLRTIGLQLPKGITKKSLSEKRIFTEADFVKLKNEKPNFYQKESKPRGQIQFDPTNNKALITLFQDKKNLSTLLHEAGHYFLYNLQQAASLPNAPQWVKENFAILGKELGFDTEKPISTDTQEKFARLAEAYFREGKAPRQELQSVFNQFKHWLTSIYKSVTKLLKTEELNDEVRSVFHRLLATEEQIAEASRNFNKSSVLEKVQEIFEIPQEKLSLYKQALEKGKQKAMAIITLSKLTKLKEVTKEAHAQAKENIEESSYYANLNLLRSKGKINFESIYAYVSENTAWQLREKWNNNPRYKDIFVENSGLSFEDASGIFNMLPDEFLGTLFSEQPEPIYIKNYVAEKVAMQSNDGTMVQLRGGYFPLQFDSTLGEKVATKEEIENIINANSFIPNAPATKKGMTIMRTGSNLPPHLAFTSVLNRHLTDSIRYATHTMPVMNSYKIIKHPLYKENYTAVFGEKEYAQLIPWLKSLATVDRAPITEWEAIANSLAKKGSLFAMGLNVSSGLMQLTSIPISISQIGVVKFMKGALRFILNPLETYNRVADISPYMKSRMQTFDKTVHDTLEAFKPHAYALKVGSIKIPRHMVNKVAYGIMSALDATVSYSTWIGAYDMYIQQGLTPDAAILKADADVIEAQGSGLSMDVTALMRKKGAWQFMTMFMSFAMNWYNRQRYYVKGFREGLRANGNSEINSGQFFKEFAISWVAPVLLTLMLKSMKSGEVPEKDALAEEFISYWLMGVPLVRDVSNFALSSVKGFKRNLGNSAAFAGIEAGVKGAKSILYDLPTGNFDENDFYGTLKNITNTLGFFTGIPTNQGFRMYEGTSAWLEGKAGVGAVVLGKAYNVPKKKAQIVY